MPRQCDARPMCAFRVIFGSLMVAHVWRLHHLGMYERSVLRPQMHFPYVVNGVTLQPLPWLVPPRSTHEAHVHLLLMAVSAMCITLGIATRVGAVTFALTYSGFVLCERTMFNNHYYLYALLSVLIALVGADQTFSLSMARAVGRGGASTCPAWHRDILRAQVCIVYMYAGIAKLNEDWIVHAQPMATKLVDEAAMHLSWTQPLLQPLLRLPETARVVSWAGLIFDLAIAPLLCWRPTRPAGLLLATSFHLTNHVIWSLGEFPWVMLATNVLFLDGLPGSAQSAWSTPAVNSPRSEKLDRQARALPSSQDGSAWSRVSAVIGVVHMLVQVLLPLRPLVIFNFDALDAVHTKSHTLLSWRMMAVTTRNFINVSLHDERLGATVFMTRTYNRLYLSHANGSLDLIPTAPRLEPRQAGYMPYTPAMLLHFARDAARRSGCRADTGCRVVGHLWSSINGRPLQRFVDPGADLATVEILELSRPTWVRPLLREFGSSAWRGRMGWLRARLAAADHRIAFFADTPDGVFNESFPDMSPFPARVLLVPLQGRIEVDQMGQTTLLLPPKWGSASHGTPELVPSSAPIAIRPGTPHAVRTLTGPNSCWAYVFGAERGRSNGR